MASLTSTLLLLTSLTLLLHVPVTQSSLTLVVDTTESMRDELDVFKREIGSVLSVLRESSVSKAENFILVPFNYPDVLQTFSTTDPVQFIRAISRLTAIGGHDCPENSLAGIQKALEISQPESQIYVFTDAYARDASNVERIWELCATTRSQVTVFLSGSCVPVGSEQAGDVTVFGDIAATCSGILFHFEASNLRQAFSFMKRMVVENLKEMSIERTTTNSNTEISLPVSPYTSSLMLAAVGDYPSLDINETDGVERIIHTRHASVIRIVSPKSQIRIKIRNRGKATLTTYSKKYFPFQYGFSTMKPSIIEETSRRPMPGRPNYFLIVGLENEDMTFSSIEVTENSMNDTTKLTLEKIPQHSNVYLAKENYYPQTPFKIRIFGKNHYTFEDFNLTSSFIEEQRSIKEPQWTEPRVEMLYKDKIAEFGTNIMLTCKVHGYPAPTIWWSGEKVSNAETNLLEIPSVYISRVTVENVTVNATYHCHAKNAKGEHSGSVDVFVHRDFVFEVLQAPDDKQIEYGTEGKLYCTVNAYPEATIKWSHNDTSVDFNENIEILTDENSLKIKNMSMDDVGTYICEISNTEKSEKYSAVITISGVDPPRIDKNISSEVDLKTGVNTNLECRILEGKPSPQISWRFLPDKASEFTDVPSDIYVKDGRLQFVDVKKEYRGVYRCEASNVAGLDYWDFTAKVLYAPIMKNIVDEATVREGEIVELPCEVEADPPARVHWEMTQRDVMQALDERHIEDELHTHRFNALWNDSGEYHCIAQNEVGKSEKSIRVIVLVAPYINPPQHNAIAARIGSSVTLSCQVTYGNPAPTTVWEFDRSAGTTTILKRGRMSNTLQLKNITYAHQGSYFCIANNHVGSDRIKITLTVQ